MNMCVNVHNVYIHDVSCINMIYETCMMVSEYFQNILLNNSKNNHIINIIKSWHVFLSHYVVKQSVIVTKKRH
jgi:hypothetical protein